ncbi:MAG: UbiH/UbiF/VisC/COQ6 family ubiquinone biosynthesis hydroxylase [Mariprofundus sp.]|nr:UbiH/UbiF/VisC/COQ6 family ubiquinone biosynthesis hydroxylase [Mariprofundus sp.]
MSAHDVDRSGVDKSDVNVNGVDVIIVGAGMVGLALACALKDTGLQIIVIERAEPQVRKSLGRDCRVSAIVKGNVEILKGLGVWQHMQADASPMRAMRIWDNQAAGGIRFNAAEIDQEALGYLVENSITQRAMHKTLLDSDTVELLCPAEIAELQWHDEQVTVKLSDGHVLTTRLLVGADGGRSWVREQAGIQCWQRDYGQKGIVATVRPEHAHRGHAFQRFLPTGPLAMLPMTGDLCSIVWSAENSEADRLMAMSDVAFLDALNLTFGPMLGRITEAGERAAFPLKAQLAKHIVRERVALVGDAAHCIHPLAGLGVNLGLRDAMVLAQEIADANRFDEDWGELDVLKRYMQQRMPDVLSVMGSMEGLHQVFTGSIPGLKDIRGLGMRVLGNAGGIKALLMRNSTGLSLPVPKQIS